MENKDKTTIQITKMTRERLAVIKATHGLKSYNGLILALIKYYERVKEYEESRKDNWIRFRS